MCVELILCKEQVIANTTFVGVMVFGCSIHRTLKKKPSNVCGANLM
jgi:hypothetical protein